MFLPSPTPYFLVTNNSYVATSITHLIKAAGRGRNEGWEGAL